MILIAESGSSKTDWYGTEGRKVVGKAKTIGLNPFHVNADRVAEVVASEVLPALKRVPEAIFFYGSGCLPGTPSDTIAHGLLQVFPTAQVQVFDDLLAAARATCGRETGIACILGTGCNSGFFRDGQLSEKIPPLGYVLGDEGSGTYLGKLLLKQYLRNRLPADLHLALQTAYPLDPQEILAKIYREPLPNRFLASFAPFLSRFSDHPHVRHLLNESFTAFFENHIQHYPDAKEVDVHFVGSIAFYFQDALRHVAASYGVRVGNVLESPIVGLVDYHGKTE